MTQRAYVPEWARDDAPTRGLADTEAFAFYKAHSVAGDCRFALRESTSTPADLLAAWRELLDRATERVETPAMRARVHELRTCWRLWITGRSYVIRPSDLPTKGKTGIDWKARALAAEAEVLRLRSAVLA